MTEILAVFRSRSQAVDALSRLKNAGVAAAAVNTPKEANVGCGLSVKFYESSLPKVRALIARGGYSAFAGFLGVYARGGGKYFRRL